MKRMRFLLVVLCVVSVLAILPIVAPQYADVALAWVCDELTGYHISVTQSGGVYVINRSSQAEAAQTANVVIVANGQIVSQATFQVPATGANESVPHFVGTISVPSNGVFLWFVDAADDCDSSGFYITPITPGTNPDPVPSGGFVCWGILTSPLPLPLYAQIEENGAFGYWNGWVLQKLKDDGTWEISLHAHDGEGRMRGNFRLIANNDENHPFYIDGNQNPCIIPEQPIPASPPTVIFDQGPALSPTSSWDIIGTFEVPEWNLDQPLYEGVLTEDGMIRQAPGQIVQYLDDIAIHQVGFPGIAGLEAGMTVRINGVSFTIESRAVMTKEEASIYALYTTVIVTCNRAWDRNVVFTLLPIGRASSHVLVL